MDKLRLLKVCRICLQANNTLIPLLQKSNGMSYYEKLIKYAKIQCDSGSLESSSICIMCITELETTVNFLDKCAKSNQILSSYCEKELPRHKNVVVNNENVRRNHCIDFSSKIDVESNDGLYPDPHTEEDISLQELQCRTCGSKRRCKHWTPPTEYKCHYCEKIFTRKFNFKLHLLRHRGSLSFPCPRCGRLRLTSQLARTHCVPRTRRTCPEPACGKTFTTNTNLHTHMRSHNGERPYICNDCGKGFTSKKTLTDHIRIHTGVKPYICPVCGKQFTTNKLSAHMRSHLPRGVKGPKTGRGAGGKRYSCGECPQKYSHKQSLNKHTRKHHGKSNNSENQSKSNSQTLILEKV